MAPTSTYADATHRFSESRRWITILFTDIVDSTRHWHEHGDVETRYRIEQHNQNLIPLVEAYDGEVIKTIGDSIMASFEDPENAVRAAIAMQHALHEVREKDPDFELKVRIGIHRGRAIVEDEDVFGNTVNVAARVEDQAQGDEILISDSVAQDLDQERYFLSRRGSFTPRGKSNSILLYRVSWWRTESLLDKVPRPRVCEAPSVRRAELVLYPLVLACAIAWPASELVPLALAERPGWLAAALNPGWSALTHPAPFATGLAATTLLLAAPAWRPRWRAPWLRTLRALVVFGVSFAAVEGLAVVTPLEWPGEFTRALSLEEVTWVRVEEANVRLRSTPSPDSPVIATLWSGHRLPLDQSARTRAHGLWHRVALAPGRYGWIADESRETRPRLEPARLRTLVARDLYALALAMGLGLAVFLRARKGNPHRSTASV